MATITFIRYQKQSAGSLQVVSRYVSQKEKVQDMDGRQLPPADGIEATGCRHYGGCAVSPERSGVIVAFVEKNTISKVKVDFCPLFRYVLLARLLTTG